MRISTQDGVLSKDEIKNGLQNVRELSAIEEEKSEEITASFLFDTGEKAKNTPMGTITSNSNH